MECQFIIYPQSAAFRLSQTPEGRSPGLERGSEVSKHQVAGWGWPVPGAALLQLPLPPISHEHLVPCGQDSSPTSHHLGDPSHPRASSHRVSSHYASVPFEFYSSALFGSLCPAPIQTPAPSPPAPSQSQTFKPLLPRKKHPSTLQRTITSSALGMGSRC